MMSLKLKDMKKFIVIFMMCCLPLISQAEVYKVCMTYADFVADNWVSIDSLVDGRTLRMPQMKYEDGCYKIKTGDKMADQILKKQAFAVSFGKQLYVNCRNLRDDDVILDVSGYTQAYRYDGNKLCAAVYHINSGATFLSLGADIASCFVKAPMSIALNATSTLLWINRDKLNSFRCFLIDSDANTKGRYPVTRMNDKFMEQQLSGDASLFARYKACKNKQERLSAANILPILMEKGLVGEE